MRDSNSLQEFRSLIYQRRVEITTVKRLEGGTDGTFEFLEIDDGGDAYRLTVDQDDLIHRD